MLWIVRSCHSLELIQLISEKRVYYCVTKIGSGAEDDGFKHDTLPSIPIIRMTSYMPLSLNEGLWSKVLGPPKSGWREPEKPKYLNPDHRQRIEVEDSLKYLRSWLRG